MGESQVPVSEPKVLIIEADTDRGRELESVLRFINYDPELVVDCGSWKAGIEDAQDIFRLLRFIRKYPAGTHSFSFSGL